MQQQHGRAASHLRYEDKHAALIATQELREHARTFCALHIHGGLVARALFLVAAHHHFVCVHVPLSPVQRSLGDKTWQKYSRVGV